MTEREKFEIDDRLRRAFGEPPDCRAIAERAVARRRRPGRGVIFAAAAAILFVVGGYAIFAMWGGDSDKASIDATILWGEINPTSDCRAPRITKPDELANHCNVEHGSAVRVDVASPAAVHGPTKCKSIPDASVLTIVYPATPGKPPEVRTVLVGRDIAIRSSASVRAFLRQIDGIDVVELTTSTASRALSLFY